MTFSTITTPFSYKGSYWAFSSFEESGKEQVYLKNVRESCSKTDYKLFKIDVIYRGEKVDYSCTGYINKLVLSCKFCEIEVFFSSKDTVCVYTDDPNTSLEFTLLFNGGYSFFYNKNISNTEYTMLNLPQNRINIAMLVKAGEIIPCAQNKEISFSLSANADGIFVSISEFLVEFTPDIAVESPEICQDKALDNYYTFTNTLLPTPKKEQHSRLLASYILWSCHVQKSKYLKRDAVYMSKNDMCNIWSWDNCMIAIALAYGQPSTALDQLLIPLDYQHENGAVPDFVNDVFCLYNFCKPPIYGWALNKIEKQIALDNHTLKTLYNKISKNTRWWFEHRDSDNDNVCEYLHGNDSGWDNSTLFLGEPPVETPDLQTFLILQMDYLISCCERLNLKDDLIYWQNMQQASLDAMLEHCFVDDFPVAKKSHTHEITSEKSLICFIPLMLAKRLPWSIRERLISTLKSDTYITDYGLATEPIDSPYYHSNGYWRGPIWGISTVMICEGLELCGEIELAKEIANKFSKLVAQSGMAENFDAVTGAPLKDKAFTWTSACYFYLSNRYLLDED